MGSLFTLLLGAVIGGGIATFVWVLMSINEIDCGKRKTFISCDKKLTKGLETNGSSRDDDNNAKF